MKKFLVSLLIIVILTASGGFISVKYMKNRIIDNIDNLSVSRCKLSYQDISLHSFSFPLHFRFSINNPQYACVIDEQTTSKIKTDKVLWEFDLMDNYLNIAFPNATEMSVNDYLSLCTNLNSINITFAQGILAVLRGGGWLESLQGLSYPNSTWHCKTSGGLVRNDKLGFDLKIWGDHTDGKTISLILNTEESSMAFNIDGSLHITSDKLIGSSINVKKISFKDLDYNITLQGDLLLAHEVEPYLRGKITLMFNNYPQIIERLETLADDEDGKKNLDGWVQYFKKIANNLDDKNLSIVLQDEGQKLSFGKASLSELMGS